MGSGGSKGEGKGVGLRVGRAGGRLSMRRSGRAEGREGGRVEIDQARARHTAQAQPASRPLPRAQQQGHARFRRSTLYMNMRRALLRIEYTFTRAG